MSIESISINQGERVPTPEEINAAEREFSKVMDELNLELPISPDAIEAFTDEPPKERRVKMEACTQGVLAILASMPPSIFALKVQLTELFSKVDASSENLATVAGSLAGLLWIFGLARIFAEENYKSTVGE